MAKRIALLHYASPPMVGGVESVIEHQARGLADQGYAVRVVSGKGNTFDPRVETIINPLFASTHPDVLQVKKQLDVGIITADYHSLVVNIKAALQTTLQDCQICIAHNVVTLHKNLPLTAALASLAAEGTFRLIAWCHDLAWNNPQYIENLHPGEPWDLLRRPWPEARYVTVSDMRQAEMSDLFGIPVESISVISPGIDPARFFRWTETTIELVNRLGLLDADGLLLLPARLTRRKNITLALHVLAALRQQSGRDFRLIVTGPPGPHNPSNQAYLTELLDLRESLDIEDAAHFLYACETSERELLLDDDTVADFYGLSDALFFPSISEGFGIPMLEAGLTGLPVFCSDIPPFQKIGQGDVTYFDPVDEKPEQIAGRVLKVLDSDATVRLCGRVRRSFRWDVLILEQTISLLEAE